jgi:uncharacterized protein (TIGR02996 family)
MPTDADFLAAVAANPADRLPRLVYADWLDERGDVRGELIRLEEETRERVAWDDTMWKLKPRRNHLRKQVPADWLTAMDYGQHCEPLFRGQPFPDDVRDAWRLIREAHERWTGEPMPDVGGHADEVAETEKRLGLTLPQSVREFVAFAHDLCPNRGGRVGAFYRDIYTLEAVLGQPALSLVLQGEGDIHWAIRHSDLRSPNPPVYAYCQDYDGGGASEAFVPAPTAPNSTVTEFVFLYMWAYTHGQGDFNTSLDTPATLRRQLVEWARCHTLVARSELFMWDDHGATVELFESSDWSVMLSTADGGGESHVTVKVWRPPPPGFALPTFLEPLLPTGGSYSGLFARPEYTGVEGRE